MKLILGLALMYLSITLAQDCLEECYYLDEFQDLQECQEICAANGNFYTNFNDHCFCYRCSNIPFFVQEDAGVDTKEATPACSHENVPWGEDCMPHCPDNTFLARHVDDHCYCFYVDEDGSNATTTSTTTRPTTAKTTTPEPDTNGSGKSGLLVPLVPLWLAILMFNAYSH